MNNNTEETTSPNQGIRTHEIVKAGLSRRRAAETRFRAYGYICIVAGLAILALLFTNIIAHAWSALEQTYVALDVTFDESILDPEGKHDTSALASADYPALLKRSMAALFPDVKDRQQKRVLYGLISSGASYELQEIIEKNPSLLGKTDLCA